MSGWNPHERIDEVMGLLQAAHDSDWQTFSATVAGYDDGQLREVLTVVTGIAIGSLSDVADMLEVPWDEVHGGLAVRLHSLAEDEPDEVQA